MTDTTRLRSLARVRLLMLLTLVLLAACTKDEANDYCKNHYLFHDQHRDSLPVLALDVSDSGDIAAALSLKGDLAFQFNSSTTVRETLLDPDNVYRIQSVGECSETLVTRDLLAGLPVLSFESRCGAGNKIHQVDVALFDVFPDLDEVEATISTPATRKHFAISRQCEGAIFRLNKRKD